MGYPEYDAIREVFDDENFQFPLWDTSVIGSIFGIFLSNFQFPLWDTNKLK